MSALGRGDVSTGTFDRREVCRDVGQADLRRAVAALVESAMGCVELWHGYRKSFAPSGLPWLLSARKGHGLGHGSGRDRTLQGRAPTQVRACVESCGWQVELC